MMTQHEELRLLSRYAISGGQGEIAQQLMHTYAVPEKGSDGNVNMSADLLRAMLEDAAWRGFCDGIDACKT